jgi:hypothetical protein
MGSEKQGVSIVTVTELRMHCPDCQVPAKASRIRQEGAEAAVPSPISHESIACSNPRCLRFNPGVWPPPTA